MKNKLVLTLYKEQNKYILIASLNKIIKEFRDSETRKNFINNFINSKEFFHFILYNYIHTNIEYKSDNFRIRYAINYLKDMKILIKKKLMEKSKLIILLNNDINVLTIEVLTHIDYLILNDIEDFIDKDLLEQDFPEYYI